jgi:hypothetical protein
MPRKPKAVPDTTATVRAVGNEPLFAYHYDAPAPDPVTTLGTWKAEGVTIRRRDDSQAMLFQHIIEWLHLNPDAEISTVTLGRWERGRDVTLYVWRKPAAEPDGGE